MHPELEAYLMSITQLSLLARKAFKEGDAQEVQDCLTYIQGDLEQCEKQLKLQGGAITGK